MNKKLGFGGIFKGTNWFFGQWEPGYIQNCAPSIEYLELYTVCVRILIWADQLKDRRILIHCDNIAVVGMINKNASSCPHCMKLIRILVLHSLRFNIRVFASHIMGKSNNLSDSLSRLQFKRFLSLGGDKMNPEPDRLPALLWPASKIW